MPLGLLLLDNVVLALHNHTMQVGVKASLFALQAWCTFFSCPPPLLIASLGVPEQEVEP